MDTGLDTMCLYGTRAIGKAALIRGCFRRKPGCSFDVVV